MCYSSIINFLGGYDMVSKTRRIHAYVWSGIIAAAVAAFCIVGYIGSDAGEGLGVAIALPICAFAFASCLAPVMLVFTSEPSLLITLMPRNTFANKDIASTIETTTVTGDFFIIAS